MAKKVAVLINQNQQEGFRMAVGLTLDDHAVSVYLIDQTLERGDDIDLNVETLGDMDGKIYTNNPENTFEQMSTEEIARALTESDVVIRY